MWPLAFAHQHIYSCVYTYIYYICLCVSDIGADVLRIPYRKFKIYNRTLNKQDSLNLNPTVEFFCMYILFMLEHSVKIIGAEQRKKVYIQCMTLMHCS